MKKIILASTVFLFALLLIAPAANAAQDKHPDKSAKLEKINLEITEAIKKYPKIRVGKAELVSKGDSYIEVKVYQPKNDELITEKLPKLEAVEEMVVAKTYTIKVDDYTRYFRRYWGKSSFAELAVGDKLWLVAADYGNDNYYGLAVKDNSIFWQNYYTKIQNIDYANQTFVIRRGDRKITVQVTDRTKLIVPGVKNPSFKDLRAGQFISLRGVVNGRTKTMDARKIKVLKLKPVLKVEATELVE